MLPFDSEPVAPATLPKNAAINRAYIPDTTCDLEFRPALGPSWARGLRTAGWILLGAMMAVPLSLIVRYGLSPFILTRSAFMITLTVACIVALWRLWSSPAKDTFSAMPWFLVPLGTWAVLALVCCSSGFSWACLLLSLAALPILALTSDSIATHAIYWMSANPSNEFSAREMVRSDWRERFSIDSTNDNNRRYQVGFALAIPCVLLSVWLSRVLVDADRVRHAKGTIALLTLSALLFAVAWFRSGFTLNSLTLTWSFISHWYNFGVNVAYPPYVFQSPAGSPLRRQLLLLASVLVMSAAVFSLTHSFFWSVEWHRSHSLEMTVFEGLWLLVRILCLFFINTLAVGVLWFLGVFFLLGPALSFTFTALEVAHGHSSPSHRT